MNGFTVAAKFHTFYGENAWYRKYFSRLRHLNPKISKKKTRSSDGVHTFEDQKRERCSRTNVVEEDNRNQPQGHVVEQVDEDEYHKCGTSEGLHVRCIDVVPAPV
jgi:hypothetical protein